MVSKTAGIIWHKTYLRAYLYTRLEVIFSFLPSVECISLRGHEIRIRMSDDDISSDTIQREIIIIIIIMI